MRRVPARGCSVEAQCFPLRASRAPSCPRSCLVNVCCGFVWCPYPEPSKCERCVSCCAFHGSWGHCALVYWGIQRVELTGPILWANHFTLPSTLAKRWMGCFSLRHPQLWSPSVHQKLIESPRGLLRRFRLAMWRGARTSVQCRHLCIVLTAVARNCPAQECPGSSLRQSNPDVAALRQHRVGPWNSHRL